MSFSFSCSVKRFTSRIPIFINVNIIIFAVPSPSLILKAIDTQKVGQSLSLECTLTTVRGINSRIDVVWRSSGIEIKRTIGISSIYSTNSSMVYRDFYNISLLTTTEEGRIYQCEGVINTISSLTAESKITLDVLGK